VALQRTFYPDRKDPVDCHPSLEGFIRSGHIVVVTLDDARFGKEKLFAAATPPPKAPANSA